MEFKRAFMYTLQPETLISVLGVPSIFMIAATNLYFADFYFGNSFGLSDSTRFFAVLAGILFLLIPVFGYQWGLIHHWQTRGIYDEPPRWQGHCQEHLSAGLPIALMFLFVIAVPKLVIINLLPGLELAIWIAIFLLSPFVIAPILLTAGKKSAGALINAMPSGIELAKARYVDVLISLVLIGFLILLSNLLFLLLSFTLVGAGLFATFLEIGFLNIIVQQFGLNLESSKEYRNQRTKGLVSALGADKPVDAKSKSDRR
jgi:hypothetical protein